MLNANDLAPPDVGVRRLLFVVTGAAPASSVPGWLSWLNASVPDLETTVVATRSASRFVTPTALSAAGVRKIIVDEWPDDPGGEGALHVRLQEWAEAAVVFPATLHYMGRLALGLADSPSLLALQSTSVPIAVVPSVPPGASEAEPFQQHWARLVERRNIVLVPPLEGTSLTTGKQGVGGSGPLHDALWRLQERRTRLLEGADPAPGRGTSSALQRCRVDRTDDSDYTWTVEPGWLRPNGFGRIPPEVARHAEQSTGTVRLLSGGDAPDRRVYRTRGVDSAAALLLSKDRDPVDGGPLPDLLRGMGEALRALHECAPAPAHHPLPPAMDRLNRWLEDRPVSSQSASVGRLLRSTVGEGHWRTLRRWARELSERQDTVIVHGFPSLGALVPDAELTRADLLTGQDTAVCAREYDLGFVLGELMELRWQRGSGPAAWQELADALGKGYGAALDDSCHRAATLRIALHLHDYAASFRWNAAEMRTYGSLLGRLLSM
ncbi:flavoprotein [Streptomonospora wellingtoniae]|uniref:Flavoprotein n=1 Tax=Streptomonospora wellingtoniae TaxID=3075544 RepID=A0ABU2KP55_9ACTN|nr:flavoprotein [Streptomonospora sp. DSM 45055]MDT0300938.1 flavoprotein [Streptomonospora sp. DSM 45055]